MIKHEYKYSCWSGYNFCSLLINTVQELLKFFVECN